MSLTTQIARQFRDVYSGGNWTAVNLKQVLAGITWNQAITKVHAFNSIASLVYHMNYYVTSVTKVLQGGTLDAHDKYSFGLPAVTNSDEWQHLLNRSWTDAEVFAQLITQLPDSMLEQTFVDRKYGTYYRNLHGIIEHIHYHLGQIVLIKKIVLQNDVDE